MSQLSLVNKSPFFMNNCKTQTNNSFHSVTLISDSIRLKVERRTHLRLRGLCVNHIV